MKKIVSLIPFIAAALMFSACVGTSETALNVDGTKPVSDENRVIYEMNIGAFTPEGTFKAAQERLADLSKLGVDIVWVMPIYPRGATKSSPYASMDYKQINPQYGEIDDFKAFVGHAHELGMKVWLDWVPNHVAVENPWVQTHPDYFNKDEKGNIINPNGWNDVYELNYENQELVNEVNSTLKFWIEECNIDGYRCDYVSSRTIPNSYWEDIIPQLKTLIPNKKVEMLSESDLTDPYNEKVRNSGFDYDYAWGLQASLVEQCRNGMTAESLKARLLQFLDESKTVKNHRMVYLTNHDQNYNDGGHTLKDFYGDNRYCLTVVEFTFQGMPLIYNGQEIGDPDTLNYFTDAKIKWESVDHKMQNTIRTLVALRHQQPDLSDTAPVSFLNTNSTDVLAWQRGKVISVVNLSDQPADYVLNELPSGKYQQWLNSATIAQGPILSTLKIEASQSLHLEAKGYAVFVKQ